MSQWNRTASYRTAVSGTADIVDVLAAADAKAGDTACPYDTAGWWQRITYHYVYPLLKLGSTRPIELTDLPPLREADTASAVATRIETAWQTQNRCTDATCSRPLWWALFYAFKDEIRLAGLLTAAESCTFIGQPILIGVFVDWLLDDSESTQLWSGILIGLGLVAVSFLQAVSHHCLYYQTMKLGWNCRIGFTGLVHSKLLRLHGSFTAQVSTGRVINLVSTDVQRFDQTMTALHFGWMGIIDLCIIAAIVCYHVGYQAGLSGITVMLLAMTINVRFSKEYYRLRKCVAAFTDGRVRIISEVLRSMLTVKAFGWELPFGKKVDTERSQEAQHIRLSQRMTAVNATLFTVAPMLSSVCTFLVYWRLGNTLRLGQVLTVLALYQVLRTAIGKKFTRFLENAPELHAAMFRFQEFLQLPEYNRPPKSGRDLSPGTVIMRDATFGWHASSDGKKDIALQSISLCAEPGKLLGVAGEIGTGKTALLLSILGELELQKGAMDIETPAVAYVPQSPWIQAGTLRENVLFGQPYDSEWYTSVLQACCLETDIAQLQDGEDTEIGEKGINLSGGQKARVALARAVYSKAPLILLDDPLSAVDPHVARSLFDDVICGLLSTRAVVLVSHHPHFLQHATEILVLGAGGSMLGIGSWKQVQSHIPSSKCSSENFENTSSSHNEVGSTFKQETVHHAIGLPDASKAQEVKLPTALVLPEDRVLGDVTWRTWKAFISNAGVAQVSFLLLLFVSAQSFLLATDIQLQRWASADEADQGWVGYSTTYGILGASAATITLIRSLLYYASTLKAASGLHKDAFSRVLYAPLAFFTANPLGRIVNRFSADQGQVDTLLPVSLFETLNLFCIAIGSLVIACYAIPYLVLTLPVLFYYLLKVRQFATASLRELKRLDGMTRSPVKGTYYASLSGMVAIRAYQMESVTNEKFMKILNRNGQSWFWWLIGNRWIGFRLDMMCTVLLSASIALAIALKDQLEPGLLGLVFIYMNGLSGTFQFMVRQSALVETYMTSVERLLYYSQSIPRELDTATSNGTELGTDECWPAAGAIQVENLSARYRADLNEVLSHISFTVDGGGKVGIVGRTGAGKSTLVQALFRLNVVTHGKIQIDGIDVLHIPLAILRSRVALIPQEPELFSGTVRYNIDPFGKYDDTELQGILQEVNLRDVSLSDIVEERGRNFSAGQQQLLSLARAMARRSKIVVIDEGTANVDYQTDAIIQKTLRESSFFRGATLLVIAHRINTIQDSDLILVLQNGKLIDHGSPTELQNKDDSIFAAMIAAAQ